MKETNKFLAALFNLLIKEGYNFLTIKGSNLYRLVNQRTRGN